MADRLDLGQTRRVHVVGVGGAGMSAIATVLADMGHTVSGSDLKSSPSLERLRSHGLDVTVGHAAVIHACTIENACLIGMHATVLDGAVVRRHALVGAGAVIAPGKVVGEGELWVGNPARCVRKLSDREIEQLHYSAYHYVKLKDEYLAAQ